MNAQQVRELINHGENLASIRRNRTAPRHLANNGNGNDRHLLIDPFKTIPHAGASPDGAPVDVGLLTVIINPYLFR